MAGKTSQENGKKGGRPVSSKTLIAQTIKSRMAEKLYERMDPIIDAMLDKAEGRLVEALDENGKIYQKGHLPDSAAFKTLIEQVLGRPRQAMELTVEDSAQSPTTDRLRELASVMAEYQGASINSDNLVTIDMERVRKRMLER